MHSLDVCYTQCDIVFVLVYPLYVMSFICNVSISVCGIQVCVYIYMYKLNYGIEEGL